jgi:BarA-like signal transduction histidine kinase
MQVKPPRILALVGSEAVIAPNVMIQMGQAGIETSIMKPLSEKDLVQIHQFS